MFKTKNGVKFMNRKCVECSGTPYNKRSNLCSECFDKILKDKIKEGETNREKEDREQENRYSWF
jgi:hypothetical protein